MTQSPTYRKGDYQCFRDASRDMLVIATPEEHIRQNVLHTLTSHYGYPNSHLDTEVLLGRGELSKCRADIVVYLQGEDEDGNEVYVPYIVVECKQENVSITQETLLQGLKYCRKLEAEFLVLTNGAYTECYRIEEGHPYQIKDIPAFEEAQEGSDFAVEYIEPDSYVRPDFEDLVAYAEDSSIDDIGDEVGIFIGADTPRELYLPILNLYTLLMVDEPLFTEAFDAPGGYRMLEDWGVRYHEFRNAGGGTWPGCYRSFLLKDPMGEDHIARVTLAGSLKTENDPHWGNRSGVTYCITAITDLEFTHNSLQLAAEKFWDLRGDVVEVCHNGTMSGKGSFKQSLVLDYIKQHAPSLVEGNQVRLGNFSTDGLIEWSDVCELITNQCVYALLRDQLRSEHSEKRLSAKSESTRN